MKLASPSVLALSDFEQQFIVETDASSIAIGSMFSQKKEDGKLHPVQFVIRTMNTSERNY